MKGLNKEGITSVNGEAAMLGFILNLINTYVEEELFSRTVLQGSVKSCARRSVYADKLSTRKY